MCLSLATLPEPNEDVIVAREPVMGDPNAVRVLFHIRLALVIAITDWVELGLKVGLPVDADLFEVLTQRAVIREAEKLALTYLTGRVRTASQVRSMFKRKEVDDAVAAAVVKRLQARNIIDDERYATWFVEQAGVRAGRQQLMAKLLRRGIERETAKQVIDRHFTSDDELQAARLSAEKYLRRHGRIEEYKDKMKLLQHLARRGFSQDVAMEIVKIIQNEDGNTGEASKDVFS